jgi:high frequency lysogenization protein
MDGSQPSHSLTKNGTSAARRLKQCQHNGVLFGATLCTPHPLWYSDAIKSIHQFIMPRNKSERNIALAGIFQAATLVDHLARTGRADSRASEALFRSLFIYNANTTEEIYGGLSGVTLGLTTLGDQMGRDSTRRSIEVTRYALHLMLLERKLASRPLLLDGISAGLRERERQLNHYDINHRTIILGLAQIYLDTIATLQPRIIVRGEGSFLQQEEIANRVRALLLSGIRAAFLWHQLGGRRWQLILRRGAIVADAHRLQAAINYSAGDNSGND